MALEAVAAVAVEDFVSIAATQQMQMVGTEEVPAVMMMMVQSGSVICCFCCLCASSLVVNYHTLKKSDQWHSDVGQTALSHGKEMTSTQE